MESELGSVDFVGWEGERWNKHECGLEKKRRLRLLLQTKVMESTLLGDGLWSFCWAYGSTLGYLDCKWLNHRNECVQNKLIPIWTNENAIICSNWNQIICIVRQVMQSANCEPARWLKDKNEYEWRLVDLTWNAVMHQDSKTSREWETNWVALLSASWAIHHATKSFRQRKVKMQSSLLNQNKILCVCNKQIVRRQGGLNTEINVKIGGCWFPSYGMMLHSRWWFRINNGPGLLCWPLCEHTFDCCLMHVTRRYKWTLKLELSLRRSDWNKKHILENRYQNISTNNWINISPFYGDGRVKGVG